MKRRNRAALLAGICSLAIPMSVRASGVGQTLPPHLIQTVSDQDIYEGMVALGTLECRILDGDDCKTAYDNVKDCVVRIDMGNAYGSGVVWKLTENCVMIATNAHVLQYWNDRSSYVHFQQGYFANATIWGISSEYDVGFLEVSNENFSYEQLKTLRCVCSCPDTEIKEGDDMFLVGAGSDIEEQEFHEGTVKDEWKYIALFDKQMLYGYAFAKEGMSGGGTFDGKGHFIGMIAGGTYDNEVVSVPRADINESYRFIMESMGQ